MINIIFSAIFLFCIACKAGDVMTSTCQPPSVLKIFISQYKINSNLIHLKRAIKKINISLDGRYSVEINDVFIVYSCGNTELFIPKNSENFFWAFLERHELFLSLLQNEEYEVEHGNSFFIFNKISVDNNEILIFSKSLS